MCDESRVRRTVFYGWWIVGVSFLTQCLTVGTVFYSFGVFFQPLTDAFGWSAAQVSWGFSAASVMGAVYSPFFGWLVDRWGPRHVQAFGALALGTGFLTLSRVDSLVTYYLTMSLLVAVGSASLGPMASNAAVAKWFVRRRGQALGFATAGISMGGVVFVPLSTWLITRFGWRNAFAALGGIVLVFGIPPVLRWMRRSPEDMGLAPDGDAAEGSLDDDVLGEIDLERELEISMTPAEAMRSRNFWLIAVSFGLTIASLSAILLHQIPHLLDLGFSPGIASFVLGGTAAVGVVGKLSFGRLIDRFDQRLVILGCFGAQAIGVVILSLATNPFLLGLYVLLYGYAMGGNVTLQATVIGEAFGRLHYGSIAGRIAPVVVTLQSLGVPLVGWIHDRMGGYLIAFQVVVAATLAAMGCILALKLPAQPAAVLVRNSSR